MSGAPQLHPGDVQRLVAYSYRLQCCRHFILGIGDPAGARAFVQDLVDQGLVTNAARDNDDIQDAVQRGGCPLNIGFTYRGLETLGLPRRYLEVFQEKAGAFAQGARVRAAQHLADAGESAVEWWENCFKYDGAHILLTLHADDQAALESFAQRLQGLQGAKTLDWSGVLDGEHLTQDKDRRTAHFGIRDGISNPSIRGFPPERKNPHEPGEFLLGYANNSKFNPWLLLDPAPFPDPWLSPRYRVERELFWNGSFAAFRKMQQHEKEFNDYVAVWGKVWESEAYVRAKITGRWDNGRLIEPGELKPPPDPAAGADLDDFDFSKDREGQGCPFGSHIRRMNPRGDPIVPLRQRPLIRRGMPYGKKYADDPAGERGLLGLFFCASLEDQFEHLLAEWGNANPMGPFNRGRSKDPFIGGYGGPGEVFDIPMPDRTLRQLDGFKPFVTTRGTLYTFFPGLPGLRLLATADKLKS